MELIMKDNFNIINQIKMVLGISQMATIYKALIFKL